MTDVVAAQAPDQVLVTGDLVHIGLESEMKDAADWLHRLGSPDRVFLVPGNHDNYAADSLQAMRRHWGDYLPADRQLNADYTAGYPVVRQCNGVTLVGVNTSCVTRVFSAAGELGSEQRQRLSLVLDENAAHEGFTCLLIHHPPFPGMTRRRKALRDATELLELVSRQPPDLVLYGHIHENREDLQGGIHSYCTASASSVHDASFRIIDLEREDRGWHCRVQLMKLDKEIAQPAAFTLAAESSWRT